jgi:hypothetical protein
MFNRYTYTQPIIQLTQNDLFIIRIPIFNRYGIVDHSFTKFKPIKFEKTPASTIDLEKSAINTNLPFDKLRSCELESLVHMWKNIKNLTNTEEVDEFRQGLEKQFRIVYFNYDISNSYMFKVKVVATQPGVIKKSKFLQFSIHVKEIGDSVTNEINPLGMLNTINEKYELRVGDILYLYLKE